MHWTDYAKLVGARARAQAVPFSLGFELTHRCNLQCEYCDRHTPLPSEMSYDQMLRALAELYALGMRHVSLDGGEPLTHRYVLEITEFLTALGVRVYMNTNGVLIPRRKATISLLDKLKISLDGPRQAHDQVRGAGAFDKAIRGADQAIEWGRSVEFTCVIGTHNADRMEELIDFAEERAYRVVFQPVRPSLFIDGAGVGQSYVADPERLQAALAVVANRKRAGSPAVANRWPSLRHFADYPRDAELPCAAGWINATLDPEGNLYHCGQVNRQEGGMNVLEHGARRAFEQLQRQGCAQCWCARVVEENFAWGMRARRFLPSRGTAAQAAPKRHLNVLGSD